MLKSGQFKNIIQNLPKYSYTLFIIKNPIRNKFKRQNAIKNFLDKTRDNNIIKNK